MATDTGGRTSRTSCTKPKASLNSLPTEIKTRIAQMCYEQDRRLVEENDSLMDDAEAMSIWHPDMTEAVSDRETKDPECVQSLRSLFCCSREWSDITAPFRFQELTCVVGARPEFKYLIAPKYGHHFKRLDFQFLSGPSMFDLLEALSRLPGPFDVMIAPPLEDVIELIENELEESPLEPLVSKLYITNTIRRIVQLAAHVKICSDGYMYTLPLCGGSCITRLDLDVGPSGSLATLFSAVEACTALSHLSMTILGSVRIMDIGLGRSPVYRTRSLKHLDIRVVTSPASLHQVLSFFSPSLQDLMIALPYWYGPATADFATELHFPQLRSLTIEGSACVSRVFLQTATRQLLPVLEELFWDARIGPDLAAEDDSALVAIAAATIAALTRGSPSMRFPRLAQVRLGLEQAAPAFPSSTRCRFDWQLPHKRPRSLSLVHKTFTRPNKEIRNGTLALDEAGAAIEDSLDAVRRMTRQAVVTGDRTQVARIAEAMQNCEWLRFEQAM
ncbi:hypothetical protein JCM10908_002267 [Rhodotorula pacifica]|uniref:uncharacterized protein n=1 Tax=Rhodotorula pacifica TaxID=1495444 RepID=UPI00317A9324